MTRITKDHFKAETISHQKKRAKKLLVHDFEAHWPGDSYVGDGVVRDELENGGRFHHSPAFQRNQKNVEFDLHCGSKVLIYQED